jgi:hypothetical protein
MNKSLKLNKLLNEYKNINPKSVFKYYEISNVGIYKLLNFIASSSINNKDTMNYINNIKYVYYSYEFIYSNNDSIINLIFEIKSGEYMYLLYNNTIQGVSYMYNIYQKWRELWDNIDDFHKIYILYVNNYTRDIPKIDENIMEFKLN